jgi:hypothetical protein
MPCHRCGARQTDPVRGASPWRRGVRAGELVLVCPDCQRGRDWTADLAHCAACGSARLVRALGTTQCKDCGAEDQVVAETGDGDDGTDGADGADGTDDAGGGHGGHGTDGTGGTAQSRSGVTTLSEDVHAALERHFRQRSP